VTDSRGGRRPTVQGWQNLVLSVMGVLVLTGGATAAVLMNRTDEVSSELVDDIQPARAAAYQLQAALRDQETALRGYAIAADRLFLQPYYDGQRTERSAADEIRSRVGSPGDAIDDLDAIERAAANWRASYAEPLITRRHARLSDSRGQRDRGAGQGRIRPSANAIRRAERKPGSGAASRRR
jgi:CHASE3 domain sensor protein